VVGRHVVDDQMVADGQMVVDVVRVAARASLMGIVRVVIVDRASLTVTVRVARASSIAMTGVRTVMMATGRAMIAVHASSTVMTVAARASSIAMTGARASLMATAPAVRGSLTGMTGARASLMATARVVRASLTVIAHAARASLKVTARVVRASSTAMTGVRAVLIAAIATSRSVRRPRRIVDAQRCSSAKVAVSTAKIIRVRLAVMTSARSLTRAQCVDRESVMFAATSGAQPTSALAINVPPIAVTAMIGERGDISFLHLVHSKSNWPKRFVARWVTVDLPM
jgi:hypothetical protein